MGFGIQRYPSTKFRQYPGCLTNDKVVHLVNKAKIYVS